MVGKQRFSFACAVLTFYLMGILVAGCSSSTTSNGGNKGSTDDGTTVATAKEELLATAKKMDAADLERAVNVIALAEGPTPLWKSHDNIMNDTTPETQAAYQRYRKAVLARRQ